MAKSCLSACEAIDLLAGWKRQWVQLRYDANNEFTGGIVLADYLNGWLELSRAELFNPDDPIEETLRKFVVDHVG